MKRCIRSTFAVVGLMILILDAQTATEGVGAGLDICVGSAIPALLPFLILSNYLSSSMTGARIPVLARIAEHCGIPSGLESIMGIGWTGGYPVGAGMVADMYRKKVIDKSCAERLLGFCNNAGPAFIFGMSANLFSEKWIGWVIFTIQIFSGICVGLLLPGKVKNEECKLTERHTTLIQSVEYGLRSMAMICAWILCFRTVLSYLQKYLLLENPITEVILFGIMELSNGCVRLAELNSEALRFIVINAMLSFGGICVWMQTRSVTKDLRLKWFVVGKVLQCLISTLCAYLIGLRIFPKDTARCWSIPLVVSLVAVSMELIYSNRKIIVASWRNILYNKQKNCEERDPYAVSQAD